MNVYTVDQCSTVMATQAHDTCLCTRGSRLKKSDLNRSPISSRSLYTEMTTAFPVSMFRCVIVEMITEGVSSKKVRLLSTGKVAPWVKNSRSLSVRV